MFYYMRNILDDYSDKQCRLILKKHHCCHGKSSILFVDEMVIPNSGVHWQAAQLDIAMMTGLAAVGKTKEQWHTLFEKAAGQFYRGCCHNCLLASGASVEGSLFPQQIQVSQEHLKA